MGDPVNHPAHYNAHPSGVECIDITEHMSFLRGNAIKYLWRAGQKGSALEDLRKARFYVDREIAGLEAHLPVDEQILVIKRQIAALEVRLAPIRLLGAAPDGFGGVRALDDDLEEAEHLEVLTRAARGVAS